MKKVIVGIGMPGSGKTTLLKDFALKYNYSYICPDDIRFEMTGNSSDQSRNNDVWNEAYKRLEDEIKKDSTVVFDSTMANQRDRKIFIEKAKKFGAQKIQGVYIDVPIKIAKKRNENRERVVPNFVLDRMSHNLEKMPPNILDGFDSVFTLDELQKVVEVESRFEGNYKNLGPRMI
jgi:predicted kinase